MKSKVSVLFGLALMLANGDADPGDRLPSDALTILVVVEATPLLSTTVSTTVYVPETL